MIYGHIKNKETCFDGDVKCKAKENERERGAHLCSKHRDTCTCKLENNKKDNNKAKLKKTARREDGSVRRKRTILNHSLTHPMSPSQKISYTTRTHARTNTSIGKTTLARKTCMTSPSLRRRKQKKCTTFINRERKSDEERKRRRGEVQPNKHNTRT